MSVQPSGPNPFSDAGASAVIPQGTPAQPLAPVPTAPITTEASQAAAAAATPTLSSPSTLSACPCSNKDKMCVTHLLCWIGGGLLILALLVFFIKYKGLITSQKISK